MSKQCVRSSLRPPLCLRLTRRRVGRQRVSGLRNGNCGVWGRFHNHLQIPLVTGDAAQGRKNRAMLREKKTKNTGATKRANMQFARSAMDAKRVSSRGLNIKRKSARNFGSSERPNEHDGTKLFFGLEDCQKTLESSSEGFE